MTKNFVLFSLVFALLGSSSVVLAHLGPCGLILVERSVSPRGVLAVDILRTPTTAPTGVDVEYTLEVQTRDSYGELTDEWLQILSAKKSAILAGEKQVDRLFALDLLNGPVTLPLGKYRLRVKNVSLRKTVFDDCSFEETPLFTIGGAYGVLPWVGLADGYVSRDGTITFPAVFGYGPQATVTFIQFQGDNQVVAARPFPGLELENGGRTRGQATPRASWVVPNNFRSDLPIWAHVVDNGSERNSTYQKVWDPSRPGADIFGGFGSNFP